MSYSERIYKKDSKNRVRLLHVYVEGADLISLSGLIDGKLKEDRSTCISKNIGKSNETSPNTQAEFEARAKIQSKMSEGYFKTIKEAENNEVILPMLAKDYNKEKKKVIFPCFIQPKLDGQRALGNKMVPMISRKGKIIDTMSHIQKELDILDKENEVYLDGELYAHGKTFQENMRLIKKYRPRESETVKYHVYDLIMDAPFEIRYAELKALVVSMTEIKIVPTYKIENEEQLKKFHLQFIASGYEGTIIRHSNAGYSINKRDSQLLKYKDFIDEAYEVIDILPSDKNPDQGVVRCTIGGGYANVTFGCGMKFSHKEREEMLINKSDYIGKIAEIRFFEYTDDGIPRFPVCHGFRNDK